MLHIPGEGPSHWAIVDMGVELSLKISKGLGFVLLCNESKGQNLSFFVKWNFLFLAGPTSISHLTRAEHYYYY